MTAAPPPTLPDFRQHLEVETPENVIVDYEIAGLGSRALAVLADTLVIVGLVLAAGIAVALARPIIGSIAFVALIVSWFALIWGYFTFFEGFRHGQTPGKRLVGIRVMRESGHPVTFRDAAARNLLRIVDFFPPPYLLGAILVALHPRAKRLGDLVAGTVVVRDRPAEASFAAAREPEPERSTEIPQLTDEEFRVLREFDARSRTLAPDARARLAERLAARFTTAQSFRSVSDVTFLRELYAAEEARRRGTFAAAAPSGGGRRGAGLAERLAAAKQDRWRDFQVMADRAARGGLDAFGAEELPEFARRYREVAADLARARTYGATPATIHQLERVVAAGHNALYRDERKTWSLVWEFFSRECPAAIVTARRYVLIAFLAFAIPALAGFIALRQKPALAEEVLPAALLDRAEEGVRLRKEGVGYAETVSAARPLVAASIITNNIGVAFVCFASGVLLGVGSLVSLAFNGALIGATSAHYANLGLLGFLWTFVAGHGVLELFAIWVAGGAGLLLGRAIIAPGELTRRDALVINGRLAMALIGAVVFLLLIAGSVEGFISSSGAPLAVKLAVSLASAVFLILYVAMGKRAVRHVPSAI